VSWLEVPIWYTSISFQLIRTQTCVELMQVVYPYGSVLSLCRPSKSSFGSLFPVSSITGVEIRGRVVRTFGPGSKGPGFKFRLYRSLYLHIYTSAARLVYQRTSGVWIGCDSCTNRPPGIIRKEEVWILGFNSGQSRNHGPHQWCPTAVICIMNAEEQLRSSCGMEAIWRHFDFVF
jgi:hypothetical protein